MSLLVSSTSEQTPGTVFFTNGVPYTYQNGMAVFHATDFALQNPQAQVGVFIPAMLG